MENLKSYLIQVKRELESGEQVIVTEPIDDIIKCLEEGEKYKQMWGKFKKEFGYYPTYSVNKKLVSEMMEIIEQKYFPEQTKEITINIEAKDKKELFRQLDKARYLIQDRLQYEKFCNFDVCSEKVQVIIKDKEGD